MNNKLDGLSMDLENANMEKLKSVFSGVFLRAKIRHRQAFIPLRRVHRQ